MPLPSSPWYADPVTLSTAVIAVATVVNLLVTIAFWRVTKESVDVAKKSLEIGNRPYVGVTWIDLHPNLNAQTLTFTPIVKNTGSVPAEKLTLSWDVFLNGISQPLQSVPAKPMMLFPNEITRLHATLGAPTFGLVMAGTAILEFTVKAEYELPQGDTCTYCQKYRYEPNLNVCMNLGHCN